MTARAALALASVLALTGCGGVVDGVPTWPGAALERAALGPADFPAGVRYDRIVERPGEPDGAGGPGPLLSRPEGCSDALTKVISAGAERGRGSAWKYAVTYDGARVVMTLLSWNLGMAQLRAQGERCAAFEAFFDPQSKGIPITTTELPGAGPDALAYQQTMRLGGAPASSVYMAFQNVGQRALFGIAFAASDPAIRAKAELPQTFLDVFTRQAAELQAS